MALFSTEKTTLKLPQASIIYNPSFLKNQDADNLFSFLLQNIAWQQDDITVFGKVHKQPRLTALYSEIKNTYSYSGITMHSKPFTPELTALKTEIEQFSNSKFNSVLLNLYRNGSDSNGWHSDNEKELGQNPIIASLSLGATRKFHFKHKTLPREKYSLNLEHGSLLIMGGEMQHHWLHQIPKTKKPIGQRINLTFRLIL